ncbi:helix-turn-helix domain-containing protein [Rhodococcus sp. KBW08]|uniref:helix-turn-helix domain-containing protein n=1 Tax=Rhodococcus sp. KBW08 TaxID=2144188 RepID=UPI0021AA9376|nr:helix-turn-helix domain-containing protein [Rhodococcus sp. KBW08]
MDRIASILELAARSPKGQTLSDIARSIDAPVSSIQGLVSGLVSAGYLDEAAGKRYTLGAATYLLNRIAGREQVSSVSSADLVDLRDATGLTSVLAIAVGHSGFYVDYASSDPRYAYLAENYVRRSLIRTSAGWVLLAGMDRRDLWSYLASLCDAERVLADRFLVALPEIQRTGLCVAPGVSDAGEGIAIAVREGDRVVAAVGVIATPSAIAQRREDLVRTLRVHGQKWASEVRRF